MDDLLCIKKCQEWNLHFFETIYEKYIDKIYNFIYRKTSQQELSEDIVSEVFMSALNNVGKFDIDKPNTSVTAWLYTIANNKIIDFYRSADKKQTQEIWEYLEMSDHHDFGKQIDDTDTLKKALKYIKGLKKEHSQIILLRVWEDLSYKEIAEVTGKSIDNCKKIVSRSLKDMSLKICLIFALIFGI